MTDGPPAAAPPLAPGDVYLYAHGNGAIFLLESDGKSRLLPLEEALSIVEGAHGTGHQVVVAADDTPIAIAVLEQVGGRGVPTVAFAASRPPHTWGQGTNALIEAASLDSDRILDDLIARGADIGHRDDSGSTALHHAAASGSLHAIDALVAAGADVDQRNDQGFTPHGLAMATRQAAAAEKLVALGARPGAPHGSVELRGHGLALYWWAVAPLAALVTAAAFLWPLHVLDAVLLVVLAGAFLRLAPPMAFWKGGYPRRLDGTTLVLRGLGRTRSVDLEGVTVAALGGGGPARSAGRGARWLVLAHPDGHPVDRKALGRLQIPPVDADALAGRIDRAIVVILTGTRRDQAVLAVGNLLSARGVDLSTALRRQLAHARGADGG